MRRAPLLLLASALALSAACGESAVDLAPPTDQFFSPSALALASRPSGGPALLVGSSNFDLRYAPADGATVLSVDPRLAPAGSAGAAGGALVKLGEGARVGSYSGPLAVADDATCPGLAERVVLQASRYTGRLHRIPVGADGSVGPCSGPACQIPLDPDLLDPYAVGVACRADGRRRSAFVGYLRSTPVGAAGSGTAWLTEINLDDPLAAPRNFTVGSGPITAVDHDAETDRLYAVGRFAGLAAPLFIVDLAACRPTDASCPNPALQAVDLFPAARGAETVGLRLSNAQAGQGRRAYVLARLYDADLAALLGARPGFDVGAALLVVDLTENLAGQPGARVLRVVPVRLGPGELAVLPPRPGRRDLVVISGTGGGAVQVYDDEVGDVVAEIAIDPATGVPYTGRGTYSLAVEDQGASARVYVAAFEDWTVTLLDVPLDAPGAAALVRDGTGALARIGKEKP